MKYLALHTKTFGEKVSFEKNEGDIWTEER